MNGQDKVASKVVPSTTPSHPDGTARYGGMMLRLACHRLTAQRLRTDIWESQLTQIADVMFLRTLAKKVINPTKRKLELERLR